MMPRGTAEMHLLLGFQDVRRGRWHKKGTHFIILFAKENLHRSTFLHLPHTDQYINKCKKI